MIGAWRWQVNLAIPSVMSELSKNRMNVVQRRGSGVNAKGQIVKSRKYLQAKARIADAVREAITEYKREYAPGIPPDSWTLITEEKLWVAVVVEKRQANIDAANVVDILLDAIQDGTGLNDSWYSIAILDWILRPVDPKVAFAIGQLNPGWLTPWTREDAPEGSPGPI